MMDAQLILEKALLLGGEAAAGQSQPLAQLCAAAASAVEGRLLPGCTGSEEPLLCGAAYLALSWLPCREPREFSAGAITVRSGGGGASAERFAGLAKKLLAAYTTAEDFAFLGVEA